MKQHTYILATFVFLLTLGLTSASSQGQESPEQTEQAIEASAVSVVSIKDFSWIAGHWKGRAMGGEFEETWNPPMAGEMMGMFKFSKNGKVVFYEILTIVPKGKSFTLRLKHFDKNLVGWEEKEKSVEFPLKKLNQNEIHFDGLVFRRKSKSEMEISVKTKSGDKVSTLLFPCQKVLADKVNSKPSKASK